MRAAVDRLCEEPGTYWTDQFHNADAITGYMGIGRELVEQTGGTLHAFCGAVGTGGMLTGVSKALKAAGCAATIVALEPASAPTLTAEKADRTASKESRRFVPPHLTAGVYDEARAVPEEEARAMARRLAREEGIFAGTSSALNVVAAIQLAREMGPGKVVATVAVDSGLKYLAGDLFSGQP
jgi:cysteine synthase A